ASAAAWPAAASDVRSPPRGKPTARPCERAVRLSSGVVRVEERSALSANGDRECRDQEVLHSVSSRRSMPEPLSRARKKRNAKQKRWRTCAAEENSPLTPPSAARSCVPDAASRSLPAASKVAPASAPPSRSPPAARRTARAPAAWPADIARPHPTTAP